MSLEYLASGFGQSGIFENRCNLMEHAVSQILYSLVTLWATISLAFLSGKTALGLDWCLYLYFDGAQNAFLYQIC